MSAHIHSLASVSIHQESFLPGKDRPMRPEEDLLEFWLGTRDCCTYCTCTRRRTTDAFTLKDLFPRSRRAAGSRRNRNTSSFPLCRSDGSAISRELRGRRGRITSSFPLCRSAGRFVIPRQPRPERRNIMSLLCTESYMHT
jgi:hypothetical protein